MICVNCGQPIPADRDTCPSCTQPSIILSDQRIGKTYKGSKNSYHCLKQIGKGGYSIVYRGREVPTEQSTPKAQNFLQRQLSRISSLLHVASGGNASVEPASRFVALKFLHPNLRERLKGNPVGRFRREALVSQQLQHPAAVKVHDSGQDETGDLWMAMELLEGMTLAEHVRQKPRLSPEEVVSILSPICDMLSEAHQKGIIHRDLKPQNIIMCPTEEGFIPRVIDFGIAGYLDDETLTYGPMDVGGTPIYMSPEHFRGLAKTNAGSDVYSLGVIIYELLSGRLPFDVEQGEGWSGWMYKHLSSAPYPLSAAISAPQMLESIPFSALDAEALPIPQEASYRPEWMPIERVVMKALSKSNSQRYQTTAELKKGLEAALQEYHQLQGSHPHRDIKKIDTPISLRAVRPSPSGEYAKETPSSLARLVAITPPLVGIPFFLQKEKIRIGRGAENDLVIENPSVSRFHAEIHINGNSYRIIDIGSSNKIFVNDVIYREIDLRDQDMIRLGDFYLQFFAPRLRGSR
jgi:serine/threonine protein kinase